MSETVFPTKQVLHWQPNAGTTASSQIVNEVTQCIESINGVKDGLWKATLTYYRPILRANKYYFIIRGQKLVLEAESSILMIIEKLQSYKSRVLLMFEGVQYVLGDLQLRVGKVVRSHSESLRGIDMEVEYLPISSMEKGRKIMEEFIDIWQETLSKRLLPGHFIHMARK
ncbi:hypothetical protein UlMin_021967, partial [Ulmus minor]